MSYKPICWKSVNYANFRELLATQFAGKNFVLLFP